MKKSLFGIIRFWDQLVALTVLFGRGMSKSIHSPAHQALCDLLIAARKEAGLTQHEVATTLGRPQSFVAKYEGGERRLDVIEFITIARIVGLDPVAAIRELVEVAR